jgi:hypothetical protein
MASELEAERRSPGVDDERPRQPIVVTQVDGTQITVAASAVRAADGWDSDDTSSRTPRTAARRRSGRGGLNDSGDAVDAIAARAAVGAGIEVPQPRRLGGRALTPAAESVADAAPVSVRDLVLDEPVPVEVDMLGVDVGAGGRGVRAAAFARSLVLTLLGLTGLLLSMYAVTHPYGASAIAAAAGGVVLVLVSWRLATHLAAAPAAHVD